jgi:protein-disulfide isomerase
MLAAVAAALFLYQTRQTAQPRGDTPQQPQSGSAPQPALPADPSALTRFHSPSIGARDAKVHVVEFFDPACEACRAVYPFVKQLMESNPARRQGKYWETLEALLESQPNWAINHTARLGLALKAISGLGLDMQRLEDDMRSPELKRLIEQDLRDAMALKVGGTPEFFINDRPLEARSFDDLKARFDQALRAAYP